MSKFRLLILCCVATLTAVFFGLPRLTDYLSVTPSSFVSPAAAASPSSVRVYFCPGTEATAAIAETISSAKQEVLIQAYSFTNTRIAKAAADTRRRGVHVVAILDRSQETEAYSCATYLAHASVETYIDSQHPIAHNKVAVIDGHVVVTGSANFSRASESNAENVLILDAPDLATAYRSNFLAHLAHSTPYQAR